MEAIFLIAIVILSVVIHEVSHGAVAYFLGDPTAKYAGRLTLNPIPHLDPIGSILLPAILLLSPIPILFGYAKPVPYNPFNLKNQRWGPALVAAAGPGSNLLIAITFGFMHRMLPAGNDFITAMGSIFLLVVLVNIALAIFNLVPIYPLDGSKVLFAILPYRLKYIETFMEQYGLVLLIFFIFFVFRYISPIIDILFVLITGVKTPF